MSEENEVKSEDVSVVVTESGVDPKEQVTPVEPPTEGGASAEGTEGENQPSGEGEGQTIEASGEEEVKPVETPAWVKAKIGQLTARLRETERRLEEAQVQPDKTEGEGVSKEEIGRLVNERARAIAEANEFKSRTEEIYNAGKKEFKDGFDQAIHNLTLVGALGDEGSPDFVRTITDLEDGHKVMQYLGSNVDEASRILTLSPTKMIMELTKIEGKLKTKPEKVSSAPDPIKPVRVVSQPGPVRLEDSDTPIDAWMAERNKQAEARAKQRRGY